MASQDDPAIQASTEDRVNAMRGFKATLSNPRTSEGAKQHARDVLDNELHNDEPSFALYEAEDQNKEPNRVAGGLKAAMRNPRVTEQAKEGAKDRLDQMASQQAPEE